MIKIICVGKLKEPYWKDAVKEYQKRLSKYINIEIIELNDEGMKEQVVALRKEQESIWKMINPKDYIVTLEIEGKEYSSKELSKWLEDTLIINSNIVFIIGGSYGLDEKIKNRANAKLSFSKLTFPHQLFRIILLEQLYRCYKIINHESYHK